jgi:RimJ/RimL family protein N-acetyltransferase
LGLNEIVATTVPANIRSRQVMEKLGMTHNPADDFDHPLLPEGHTLRRHVLYRLKRADHGNENPYRARSFLSFKNSAFNAL